MGKLAVIVGDGWNKDQPELKAQRLANTLRKLPNAKVSFVFDPAQAEPVKVVKNEGYCLTCEMPAGKLVALAVSARGADRWSEPYIINRAWPQWLSKYQAAPGEILRVFGRNLVNLELYSSLPEDGKPLGNGGYIEGDTSIVIQQDQTDSFYQCKAVKQSAYDVHFVLPEDLKEGNYRVFVHNGLGGQWGWSEGLELKVGKCKPWPQKQFNVKDFGATGVPQSNKGWPDETVAIKQALKAAEANGGGVVYFPAGSYLVTETLTVPEYTVLKGQSRERSWIWFPDGIDHGTRQQGYNVKVGIKGISHFGIENLSIHGVYNTLLIAAPLSREDTETWQQLDQSRAEQVFVRNCYVFQEPTYRYHHRNDDKFLTEEKIGGLVSKWGMRAAMAFRGDNISITDCEIKGAGMPIAFIGCRYSQIARNRIFTGKAANGFCAFGSDYPKQPMQGRCIFEDNIIIPGTAQNHSGFWCHATSEYFYVARNFIQLLWVSDAEGLLWHGAAPQHIFEAASAADNNLVFKDTKSLSE